MKNPFKKYSSQFSENKLWIKVSKYAKQAGVKVVYSALLLFYAYKRKDTPSWAKNIILGTLGYFLSPIDAIPDLSPIIGYTDDIGVLSFGLVTIAAYVNTDVRKKARGQMQRWFGGEYDEESLQEVDAAI
jgi:uncharacterized membrane protein YkvA (DUF1232 family)